MGLGACATSPEKIPASYISSKNYTGYSCVQINQEAGYIRDRLTELTGQQETQAKNDAALTAVSLLLFWPAAFAIGGDDTRAAEIGRLKGEAEALRKASIARGCGGV